jgi:hypothetical protein
MSNTLQENIGDKLNEFSNVATPVNSSFGDSNGIIAKFGFFVLVVIVFILALNLGIRLISYFMSPPKKTVLIKGLNNGGNKVVVTQDPKNKDSKLIRRSNNELSGIEFTWSLWLRIDGLYKQKYPYQNPNPNQPSESHHLNNNNIFVKGDGFLTNAPGLYINNSTNTLTLLMDTSSKYAINEGKNSTQVIDIPNIPLKKWFHLIIRCQNKYLDVYMNGLVVYRTNLINVPLQNYDNVIICNNGGFNGVLSNLIYYDYALNAVDINGITITGPDLTDPDKNAGNVGPDYLSTMWYNKA